MDTVYLINGFLEAGKTTFIKEMLGKKSFRIPGKTLIILCEEGDIGFDEKEPDEANCVLESIEEEKDFNEEHLLLLIEKHRPERVIVEFNGMWDRKKTKFPKAWDDIMEITVFDASTFKLYSDNLRPFLYEQVRNAELIIFNRAEDARDKLASYARNIKAINEKAAFVFRGKDGDIVLDPDESLPYDINKDELILDDVGFAVMTIDSHERYEVYEGKKVSFTARVYKMKDGGDFQFVAGRHIMTCCEADLSFTGIICGYSKAYTLENREWISVSGIMRVVFDEAMDRDIPVVKVTGLKKIDPPDEEYISLV